MKSVHERQIILKKKRKKILFLCPYFFPGFRAGGPQQTVANIADMYGDDAHIYILTQNHDLGMKTCYEDVKNGQWLPYGKAKVKYLSRHDYRFGGIKKEYMKFDTVYSCGMFEPNTISVLIIHRLSGKKQKLYAAPMGVFSRRALKSKYIKKMVFLRLFYILGMFQDIIWSFSSLKELEDAKRALGHHAVRNYIIAEDIPRKADFSRNRQHILDKSKKPGSLRIVFLSRICRQKNLGFCMDILQRVKTGKVRFDIYGIIEDQDYWKECREKIKKLPAHISVRYCGIVKPDHVMQTLQNYDVFLFPTKGENYGHVIYEALCAGCVPVVSDTTPWDVLTEKGAGEIISYNDIEGFRKKIEEYLEMESQEIVIRKMNAVQLAEEKYKQSLEDSGYRELF